MRKLIVIPPPFVTGGIEQYLAQHVLDRARSMGITIISPMNLVENRTGLGFYNNNTWMAHCSEMLSYLFKVLPYVSETEDHSDISILFTDLWFPGLEMVATHRALNDKKYRIAAWIHGASFVDGDLVQQWVPQSMGEALERSWLESIDVLWAGSRFFIRNIFLEYKDKVQITGQPFDPQLYQDYARNQNRDIDVVLPCRFAKDKIDIPRLFQIVHDNPDLKFLITSKAPDGLELPPNLVCEYQPDENDHLDVLSRSRVVFSMATQEGWGYGVMKAIACGCSPVLPNWAVYPELYSDELLYSNWDEASQLIKKSLENPIRYALSKWDMSNPIRDLVS